jgi:hypothetical protein
MIRYWRLNERTQDNLGLACTEDGLFLGRTPLIERRDQRYVVRERSIPPPSTVLRDAAWG